MNDIEQAALPIWCCVTVCPVNNVQPFVDEFHGCDSDEGYQPPMGGRPQQDYRTGVNQYTDIGMQVIVRNSDSADDYFFDELPRHK